jgi:hypothetical protein
MQVVIRSIKPSSRGTDAEQWKVIARDQFTCGHFCLGPGIREEVETVAAHHPAEDLAAIAEVLVHGIGERVAAVVAAIMTAASR